MPFRDFSKKCWEREDLNLHSQQTTKSSPGKNDQSLLPSRVCIHEMLGSLVHLPSLHRPRSLHYVPTKALPLGL